MSEEISALEYKDKFHEWLIGQGMSMKVANNIISRCKRVEKIVGIKIVDNYKLGEIDKLYEKLRAYAYNEDNGSKSRKSMYALNSTLKYAAKKYVKFLDDYL